MKYYTNTRNNGSKNTKKDIQTWDIKENNMKTKEIMKEKFM